MLLHCMAWLEMCGKDPCKYLSCISSGIRHYNAWLEMCGWTQVLPYNKSYLLRHPLSLVGKSRGVAIPPSLTPCQLAQLKLLPNHITSNTHNRQWMYTAHLCQLLLHLWHSLLHCRLLDECTSKLRVLCTDLLGGLVYEALEFFTSSLNNNNNNNKKRWPKFWASVPYLSTLVSTLPWVSKHALHIYTYPHCPEWASMPYLSHLTLSELVKDVLRFELMLSSNGSLQVMRAMPAVRFLTMCWAAMCIRWRSGSKLKSCKITTQGVI